MRLSRATTGIVAVAISSAIGVRYASGMLVEHIDYTGLDRATSAELRLLMDVRNGTRIWEADLSRAALGMLRHPWVREATVTRDYPNRLQVEVAEYAPAALLHFDNQLYFVDGDGTAFLQADSSSLDHPVIYGIDAEIDGTDPRLGRAVLVEVLSLMDDLRRTSLLGEHRIGSVTFGRYRGYDVEIVRSNGGPGARLLFGFEDRERQVHHLLKLVEQGVELGDEVQIDLAPATVAVVRPLHDPADF